jgi:hypothetical protein
MTTNMEPYIIFDSLTGREICQCASWTDTLLMISFDPDHRQWKKRKYVLDQVVDVPAEVLPADKQLKAQKILPDREAVPFSP